MSLYRSKGFWIAFTIFAPLLLVGVNYGVKVMTSVYKQDLGNGVVVYADDYVKTGRWVFDCKDGRLISREPLPVPIADLKKAEKFAVGRMYGLSDVDEASAKEVIQAILKVPDWYQELRYLYSFLNEYSELNMHTFYMIAHDKGRSWALEFDQSTSSNGKSSFDVIARPYDPETYVDYAKALEAAAKSCPVPQSLE